MFDLANSKTSVLFILGKFPEISLKDRILLQEEHDSYKDIIQIDSLIDSYNNLTLKSLFTLKFFLSKGR